MQVNRSEPCIQSFFLIKSEHVVEGWAIWQAPQGGVPVHSTLTEVAWATAETVTVHPRDALTAWKLKMASGRAFAPKSSPPDELDTPPTELCLFLGRKPRSD